MTAYLKAHYPVEFMAALLSGDIPGRNFKTKDSLVEHLEDCRRMGVEVLPPDVNASYPDFTVRDGKIRFGLTAVKGCGGPAAAAVAREREERGPFADIFDFCQRVDAAQCSRSSLESLVKAGAFDSTGMHRAQCMALVERAITQGAAAAKDRKSGQRNMFDALGLSPEPAARVKPAGLPDVTPWSEREKLACEKEVLGFYFSSHPLSEHEQVLNAFCTHTTAGAAQLSGRTEVHVGGMLSAIRIAHTKNPRPGQLHTRYAMFDLEDRDGTLRCIIWPETYATYGHLVKDGAVLAVRASVDRRQGSDEANLIVSELIPLDELVQKRTKGVVIQLEEEQHNVKTLESLYEILRGYPGPYELELHVALSDGSKAIMQCEGLKLALDSQMQKRVDELLGPGALRRKIERPKVRTPEPAGRGRNGRP
jgi:DNA polymerase-3 subunit alpha